MMATDDDQTTDQPQQAAYHTWDTGKPPTHTGRCQCRACEKAKERQHAADRAFTGQRLMQTVAGQSPDLAERRGWHISADRLVSYMVLMSQETDDARHIVRVEPKPSFLRHVDQFSMKRAIQQLGVIHPTHARVLELYFPQDEDAQPWTQERIGREIGLHQSNVSHYIRFGVRQIQRLYVGLTMDLGEEEREEIDMRDLYGGRRVTGID